MKTRSKFPATTSGYSMAKMARLDDVFSDIFELAASSVEFHSLHQKIRKGEKGKAKKLKQMESLKISAHARA